MITGKLIMPIEEFEALEEGEDQEWEDDDGEGNFTICLELVGGVPTLILK